MNLNIKTIWSMTIGHTHNCDNEYSFEYSNDQLMTCLLFINFTSCHLMKKCKKGVLSKDTSIMKFVQLSISMSIRKSLSRKFS